MGKPAECGFPASSVVLRFRTKLLCVLMLMLAVTALPAYPAGGAETGTAGAVDGFVIRLASAGRQFTEDDLAGLELMPAQTVYTTAFRKDGRDWQQLRLGFFSSRSSATAAAQRLQADFPGAQVTAITALDRRAASTRIVSAGPAIARAEHTGSERKATPSDPPQAGAAGRSRSGFSALLGGIGRLSPARWSGNYDGEAVNVADATLRPAPVTSRAATAPPGGAAASGGFDHATTGFPLEGAHAVADCSSCHLRGVFRGTPRDCYSCHGPGSRMSGQAMSPGHIKSLPLCEECHTSRQWVPLARMNHDAVSGSCSSCHDGINATGKTSNHISSGNNCETCHVTFAWTTASFDHGAVAPGTCFSCHNGATATGKKPNHVASANTCDDCHSTGAWIPARFDHGPVTGSCSTCHNGSTATGRNVTHISTTGTCEACHHTSAWKPVPYPDHAEVLGTCFSCHNGTTAPGKSPGHIASSNTCDDCHTTSAWTTAVFDHSSVTGSCSGCHNGTTATGRNATHIQTTNACEDCHGTTSFSPALRVDHADVIGTCYSCHNGTTAPGKTPGHIASSNTCDDCHTTSAWLPAVFDHSGVTAPCSTCHNGTTATGKSPTHIQTSGQCDDCHSTLAWIPASFDHNLVTGSCASCHNGTTATGKSPNHFGTTLQCDECHGTVSWTTIIFRHASGAYPGDHAVNPTCIDCHTGNSQVVPWPSPSYQPDCAGCHASDYRPGAHQNATVSQNRDCAGTCHRSTPEHSVRDRTWD